MQCYIYMHACMHICYIYSLTDNSKLQVRGTAPHYWPHTVCQITHSILAYSSRAKRGNLDRTVARPGNSGRSGGQNLTEHAAGVNRTHYFLSLVSLYGWTT